MKTSTKTTKVSINDIIVTGVSTLVSRKGNWSGSMSELNASLIKVLRNVPQNWPGSPSVLRVRLNKVLSRLRRTGVKASFGRTPDHARKRFVTFMSK